MDGNYPVELPREPPVAKYTIFSTLLIFSLGCIKTLWGNVTKFGNYLARLSQKKYLLFVYRYIQLF